jgi:hypothetical protein
MKFLNQRYDELKQKYKDEWVAVMNRSVIDHAKSLDRLLHRLRKTYQEALFSILGNI